MKIIERLGSSEIIHGCLIELKTGGVNSFSHFQFDNGSSSYIYIQNVESMWWLKYFGSLDGKILRNLKIGKLHWKSCS
jgi:hypothetical protein